MIKTIFTGIALVAIGVSVSAADYELASDLGASARSIGLGNVEGFNRSASSVFENPATLQYVESASGSFFTTTLLNEVYYKSIALAGRTPLGVIGVGFQESTVFDIPKTGESAATNEYYVESYFDYKDTIAKLTYQIDLLSDLSFGASYVHYNRTMASVKAKGGNIDVGLLYAKPNYEVSLFARNANPGGRAVFELGDGSRAYETLPTEVVASGRYRVVDGVVGYAQLKSRNEALLKSIAASYTPREFAQLDFRLGYREYLVLNDVKGGLTAGVGLRLSGIEFDYAFEKLNDHPQYDNKSYFSISMNF